MKSLSSSTKIGPSRLCWPRHLLRGSYVGDPMLRFVLASSLSAAALEASETEIRAHYPLTPSDQVGCAKLESLLDLTSRGDTGPEVGKMLTQIAGCKINP